MFVMLMSHDCYVALPRDAIGLSAVCVCGISYLLYTKYNVLLAQPIFKETISCRNGDMSQLKLCKHHRHELNHYL